MRAARVDANHAEVVEALRAYGCKVQDTSAVGRGFPDLVILTPPNLENVRRIGLIEVKDGNKRSSARALTRAQIAWWHEWSGAPMAVVTSVDQALAFVRRLTFGSAWERAA